MAHTGKSQEIECPICGKPVRARGLQSHLKGCQANPDGKGETPKGAGGQDGAKRLAPTPASRPEVATDLIVQRRAITMPLTPTLLAFRKLAIEQWSFPVEMPLEDLIDTGLYACAWDRGFELNAYVRRDGHASEQGEPEQDASSEGDAIHATR